MWRRVVKGVEEEHWRTDHLHEGSHRDADDYYTRPYHIPAVNGNDCPRGSSRINDTEACQNAAAALSLLHCALTLV